MTQYHKPQVGEFFTDFAGRQWRIDRVWYATHRDVFRVTYCDDGAATGIRGCQISRGDGDEWAEWEAPKYVTGAR